MPRPLVVKLTCGADDAERANQGLTVAVAALAAGAEVSVWLTGEGVWFASTDRQPDLGLRLATPVTDLVGTLGGSRITVCTQCAARRGLEEADLVAGATIAGAASFAAVVLEPGVQALVY